VEKKWKNAASQGANRKKMNLNLNLLLMMMMMTPTTTTTTTTTRRRRRRRRRREEDDGDDDHQDDDDVNKVSARQLEKRDETTRK
jgi:hypothetical protein